MLRPVLVVGVVLASAGIAAAQKPTDIARWSVAPARLAISPGSTATVTLTADVEEGWHLYAISQPKGGPPPLAITIAPSQPFELRAKEIDAPPPQIDEDPNFKTETHYWEGQVAIVVPLAARKEARAGAHRLPIDVTFQVCSTRMCLRPYTETLFVDTTIRPVNAKETAR